MNKIETMKRKEIIENLKIEDLKKAEEYLHLLIAYNVENERIRQSVMERK